LSLVTAGIAVVGMVVVVISPVAVDIPDLVVVALNYPPLIH
jgi:hypothetical protein